MLRALWGRGTASPFDEPAPPRTMLTSAVCHLAGSGAALPRPAEAPTGRGTRTRQGRSATWPDETMPSVWRGAIDQFLGVAIERPALDQLEVEVACAAENRARSGPSGDDGEDCHLKAVDQAGGHQRPVQRQ